jgi:DNA-directed RNA polymerase subunit D
MEKVLKTQNKEILVLPIEVSLANSIRRTINEINTLAIREVDIYRNDSSFSDEILAHRIGMIPLKNEKVKQGDVIELKMNVESNEEGFDVLSGSFGDSVCILDLPIIRLNKGQGIEIVARASIGTGKEHARHIPGLVYYYHLNKINLKPESKKHTELAENHPEVFEFDKELKVKNEWACNFDSEDLNVPGVEITPTEKLVFIIETWGMLTCAEILAESVKTLDKNLEAIKKVLK